MKKTIGVLLAWMGILLAAFSVQAADKDLFIDGNVQKLFSAENGLLSNSSTAIAQTKEGYIWIGSYGGLVRYDGYSFEAFGQGELANIKDLMAGENGELWISTADQGLICYQHDEFIKLEEEGNKSFREVECLTESVDGTIWIGTANGVGIVGERGQVSMLEIPELEGTFITHITAVSDQQILCVTRPGELYSYNGQECRQIDLGDASHDVRCVTYNTEDGNYYIGTSGQKLIRCDENLKLVEAIDIPQLSCINDILCRDGHVLWLCADNGVGIYQDGRFRIQRLKMDNSIDKMMVDAEGSFWFVSSRQGLLEVSESRFGNISQSAGLESLVVNAVVQVGKRLYIGHDEGLKILDADTYEEITDPAFSKLHGVRIRCLKSDEDGNLWFATKGKGLLCYQKNGQWRSYSSKEYPVIRSDNFRCIFQTEDVLLAGTDSGVYVIDEEGAKDLLLPSENFEYRVLCIGVQDGRYYLGTDGYGVYVAEDGKIVEHLTMENGLQSNVVMKLCHSDTYQCLWMVTGSNLAWIGSDMKVHNVEGFPSANNLDLVIVNAEEVWIPSGGGIFQTTEKSLMNNVSEPPKLFRHIDGMPYEVAANSNQYLEGSVLYLCGAGGVFSLETGAAGENRQLYQMVIDNIKADNVRTSVQDLDEYRISPDVRRIEISAYVLTYRSDDPQIFYYLEGFDDERTVSRLSEHPSISYTNLYGGEYVFHFGILDETTQEPVKEILLPIRKEYHWFEKREIRYLAILLAILAIIFISQLAEHIRMRKQNQELKEKYEQREKERLREMAFQDYLTGLYNRNYLELWNEQKLSASAYPVTFVTIDCNGLKKINDNYGHKKGDQMLQTIADLLRKEFCQDAYSLLRYGGDEFLVLASGVEAEIVREKMEHVRSEAEKIRIETVPLTFSYGICSLTEDNFDFEEGLRSSDLEMLAEKRDFYQSKNKS